MSRILLLRDLLAYLEPDEPMQIGIADEDEWSDCIDIKAGSPLLKAYSDWDISCLGAETDNSGHEIPVIRVMIKKPE